MQKNISDTIKKLKCYNEMNWVICSYRYQPFTRESMKFKNYDLEMMPITTRSWPKKFFWQITKYIQYYIFYIILYIQGKDLKNFVQV